MNPDAINSKDRLIGKTIGKYEIIDELGEGGMGKVYLADDKKLGRKAALKFVLPQYVSDKKRIAQFEQEARITAALNHPNIVTIYDFDENINGYYIAMEYVEGQSLKDLIKSSITKKEYLRFEQICDIVIQISKGLLAAHKKPIIHRDLKPGNILVSVEGTAKISDFGLAKLVDATSGSLSGGLMGTPEYMSPEQIRLDKLDQRSDIFSLGIVLYELITLKRPFDGIDLEETLDAIKNKVPEALTRHRQDVPEGLQRIVDKTLNKDRRQRYQNVNSLLAELVREQDNFLKTKSLYQTPPPDKRNNGQKSISNWRKPRNYFTIGTILLIIGVIANVLEIRTFFLDIFKSTASVISIFTEPEGAAVLLNEKFIGTTPINNTPMQVGEISLKISKPGYLPIDTLLFVSKEINWPLTFKLKEALLPLADLAAVRIVSQPSGAAVFLNGKQVGVTVFDSSISNNSMLKLRLQKPDFFPLDTAFVIRRGQDSIFTFALRPAARVSIKANVAEAKFRLDGKLISRARLVDITLPVGQHRIEITAEGYTSIKDSFSLSQGINPERTYRLNKIVMPSLPTRPVAGSSDSTSKPNAELAPRIGILKVLVIPFGSIYIDGKPQYIDGNPQKEYWNRQFKTELAVGAYLLRAEHPKFGTWEKKIIMEAGNPQEVKIDFNKSFKLTVTSTPVLGKIFVDEKEKGYAPKELTLPAGKRRIEVRRDGYVSPPQVINIDGDINTPLRFEFKKIE